MNNIRYESSIDSRLRRVLVVVAIVALTVLTINALRISGAIPNLPVLRAIAPIGAIGGCLVIGALGVSRRRGTATVVATLAAVTGLTVLAAIEFITNYVFPALPEAVRTSVLGGATGALLMVASIGFIVVMIAFAAVHGRSRSLPLAPLALLTAGSVVLGLRTFLPVPVVSAGLVALGAAALWLTLSPRSGADGPHAVAA